MHFNATSHPPSRGVAPVPVAVCSTISYTVKTGPLPRIFGHPLPTSSLSGASTESSGDVTSRILRLVMRTSLALPVPIAAVHAWSARVITR